MSDQPSAVPAAEAASNPTETSNGSNGNAQDLKATEASAEVTAAADATAGAKSDEQSTEQSTEKRNHDDANYKRGNDKRKSGGRPYRGNRGGFRGDHYNGRKPHRRPIDLSEYDNLPESSDPNEIRIQVEFYFSDVNLKTDKHLFEECRGPENFPVKIKHLCDFNRMRRFKPYSAVVDALRASEFLEVVDDGSFSGPGNEGVRRKSALVVPDKPGGYEKDPPTMEDLFKRCQKSANNNDDAQVYAKGFLEEDEVDGKDVGQLTLEQFFKPYGSVAVRKRKDEGGLFKGSVFAYFESKEAAEQFVNLDPKPTFEGRVLLIELKKDFIERKCAEKGIVPDYKKNNDSYRGRGRGRGGGDRGRGDRGRGGSRSRGRGGRDGRDDRRRRNSGGDDWNERRNRFQADKGDNKRKAEDDVKDSPKKAKLEIKEDA